MTRSLLGRTRVGSPTDGCSIGSCHCFVIGGPVAFCPEPLDPSSVESEICSAPWMSLHGGGERTSIARRFASFWASEHLSGQWSASGRASSSLSQCLSQCLSADARIAGHRGPASPVSLHTPHRSLRCPVPCSVAHRRDLLRRPHLAAVANNASVC